MGNVIKNKRVIKNSHSPGHKTSSSDDESFIAVGTFCHNGLAQNAIVSTPKHSDHGFSGPSKQILQSARIFLKSKNVCH